MIMDILVIESLPVLLLIQIAPTAKIISTIALAKKAESII